MTLKSNNVPYSGGKSVPVLEAGNYPARVVQVIDLGLQAQRPYEGQEKPPAYEILVTYELGTEFMEDDDGNPDESKPRWVSERFSIFPLASEKAKSTKRYTTLDPKLQHGGDWSKLIGTACLVAVVQNQNKKTGKIYNNVGGISPPIKGMSIPELVNPGRVFDQETGTIEQLKELPEWIQTIISEGLEFKGSRLDGEVRARDTEPGLPEDEVPF